MRINHNVPALNTYRHLNKANSFQQGSMQKLSSGLRINSAADDAAGLAISERCVHKLEDLTKQQLMLKTESLLSKQQKVLYKTQDILQRMRELAVQSSNDTNTEETVQKSKN